MYMYTYVYICIFLCIYIILLFFSAYSFVAADNADCISEEKLDPPTTGALDILAASDGEA